MSESVRIPWVAFKGGGGLQGSHWLVHNKYEWLSESVYKNGKAPMNILSISQTSSQFGRDIDV